MKFAKLGIFAFLASLASALDLSLLGGANVEIGASISVNVVLGETTPGCYDFVLYNSVGEVIQLLEAAVDILTDCVVPINIPGYLEPGPGYKIGCCPADDYYNPFTVSEPFECQ